MYNEIIQMPKFPGQMTGNLTGLILAVLEREPLHGYAVAREIEKRSSDALSFGEGAIYPALRILEQDGSVVSVWDTGGSGPARKVYHLTPHGTMELARFRDSWRAYTESVDRVLQGKPEQNPA